MSKSRDKNNSKKQRHITNKTMSQLSPLVGREALAIAEERPHRVGLAVAVRPLGKDGTGNTKCAGFVGVLGECKKGSTSPFGAKPMRGEGGTYLVLPAKHGGPLYGPVNGTQNSDVVCDRIRSEARDLVSDGEYWQLAEYSQDQLATLKTISDLTGTVSRLNGTLSLLEGASDTTVDEIQAIIDSTTAQIKTLRGTLYG